MSTPPAGRFIWHDLMTTSTDAALEYYTKLLGWTINEFDIPGMGKYLMLRSGEEDIGGIVPLEESGDVPSHWIGYVTVEDVDAAVERATGSGGTTCVTGTDIPGVGRFAVVRDPTGGTVSPFRSLHGDAPEPEGPPAAGTFCWDELLTNDPERAGAYYCEVFGWTTREMDMGPMGKYVLFLRGEKESAGMMMMPADAGASPHWLSYVAVEDVDASAVRVAELGGQILVPPTDIPGVGRFTVTADPTGAKLGLLR